MGIFDRSFTIFGWEFRIRILPRAFVKEIKRISGLIDENRLEDATHSLREAYQQWGEDDDIVYLASLVTFLSTVPDHRLP